MKRLFRLAPVLVAIWLCCSHAAFAADWPQFRGASRDMSWNERGPWRELSSDSLKPRWHQAIGPGYTSPVIAQGRVFLFDAVLKRPNAQERLLCFEEKSGQLLWSRTYGVTYPDWVFVPGQEAGPTATPVVEAGRVYALGANGHVHCWKERQGDLVWERDLGRDYQLREFACRPSPLLDGSLLILSIGGKSNACVVALDKNSGKEIWRALEDPVSNSSPILIRAGGQKQLIVWTGESVTSLDPATGKTWWREPAITSNNDAIATPVFLSPLLLVGGWMFRLDSDQPKASPIWPESKVVTRRILSNTSTACLREDAVYSARSSGELVCLDAGSGRQLWMTNSLTDLRGGSSIHLIPTPDAVFLFTDHGDLIRANLSRQGYEELGRAHVLDPTTSFGGRKVVWAIPSFAGGCVFARSDTELVCVPVSAKAK